jgi:hypothetical protein
MMSRSLPFQFQTLILVLSPLKRPPLDLVPVPYGLGPPSKRCISTQTLLKRPRK